MKKKGQVKFLLKPDMEITKIQKTKKWAWPMEQSIVIKADHTSGSNSQAFGGKYLYFL